MMNSHKNRSREGEMLINEMRRFKRFYRLQVLCNIFSGGIVLAIVFVLSAYLYKISTGAPNISLWFFMIPLFLSIIFPLFKPIHTAELALRIDAKLGLKERLITAFSFLGNRDEFATFLFRDTLAHLKMYKPQYLFPFNWSRALLLFTMLIGTLILYDIQTVSFSQSSETLHITDEVKLVIQKEGTEISRLTDRLNKNHSLTPVEKKILIQKLNDLGDRLKSGKLDKKEALLMLTDLSSSVRQLKRETADPDSPGIDNMEYSKRESTESSNDIYSDTMDSLRKAKRNIAEADLYSGKENGNNAKSKGSVSGTYSSTGSILRGDMGTDPVTGNERLSSSKSNNSPGEANFRAGDEENTLRYTGSIPDGIIRNYPDSIIALESLPGRYHKMVIQYFDAISKENEID